MTTRCTAERAAILLETLVSLAILVMCAMAVLSTLGSATRSLELTRETARAADLARSAIALMEAGIATPEQLDGHVPAGGLGSSWGEESGEFDDSPPEPSPWVLSVEATPSQFRGLSIVSVRASRLVGDREQPVGFAMTQLVALASKEDDTAGELDPLGEAATEGER